MSQLGLDMDTEERHRRRERHGRRATLVALLLVLALLAAIVVGGWTLWQRLTEGPEDFAGTGTDPVQVQVEPGDSASAIGRTLEEAGVVASLGAFRDAAEADPRSSGLQPGSYALRKGMSAAAALDLMLDPSARVQDEVTVPEGLRVGETLRVLSEGTGIPVADFRAALERPEALGLPAWAGGRAEGLLFPATYTVDAGATAAEVLAQMVRRFGQAAEETGIAGSGGAKARNLLTVASIVQAEAPPQYMRKVARVVYNRLAAGRPLQLDTTVDYANGKRGVTTTPQDRANPSPYNTYANAGLPPGPIASPGTEAMRAAVDPEPGPWLFFVAVDPDTGETRFAVTEQEHAANVELFRQWLARRGDG
ncbi:endolytic transglycosylase MltG [Vallicoccus soli]|uniref:Endolytic murein transglycosylase n=1 Tax=Vallicoccus soli TaxID=2339232 RepID=A0A3A3Z273_9ACTN|nr:endolytic transglycosylase MltG [Vallicoccus soli]RJK96779.1 endolytic transglycosylase MltG [Vallicoccus soli]